MLTRKEESHDRQLRSTTRELCKPRSGRYYDRTWRNQFLIIYDDLPTEIKELDLTKKRGKQKLRDWIKRHVEGFV